MRNVDVDLSAMRQAAGLTVLSAAKAMGVSRRTWQRWEASGRMPWGALKRFESVCAVTKSKGDDRG